MAKKAWTTRNEKKQRTADKYRAKRAELKAAGD